MATPRSLLHLLRGLFGLLASLAVVGLIGWGAVRWAETRGVEDLTRDAGFADHHPPAPDPRSEDEMEDLRRFPVGAVALQPLIDATPTGGTLRLEPKIYAAPGKIDRAMRIEGVPGETVVDGGGIGSILTVTADDVMITGLTLRNSGDRHETTDSAVRLRARHGIFKDNVVEDCLFGFELKQADENIIRRNKIGSKNLPQALRGDSIRVWYSNGNRLEDNEITEVRDTVIWYSTGNIVTGNRILDSRYGIHLMYSHKNKLEHNSFLSNTVGIFLMYANDNDVIDNVIHYSQGPSGIGLGFKESSNTRVLHNDFFANARGIFMDASPYDPEGFNLFQDNRIAYNGAAIAFHSQWEGNTFEHNAFLGNHTSVTVLSTGTANRNKWRANYWDDWEGFDRNRDGIGDTPYENWSWADRLWMDVPDAQFFRAAPSLELVDFVERLGSLLEPRLIMRDPTPLVDMPADVGARGTERLERRS
ncbi:MAG: nitrous oxide reductase family maturation protein NosD [Phyllobacteriaceae bacterium]|nr:nitrous oxide reductase family maturation protein NosD [Phyllobacteriaceae bacterium]